MTNLKASGGARCITIATSNVAIDLQGHSITGGGSGEDSYGIFATTGFDHIIVANGTITNFALSGIYLQGSFNTIAQMTVQNNEGGGIFVADGSTVTDTVVSGNGGSGITTEGYSFITVAHSRADDNGGIGIQVNTSTVANSQANGNASKGIRVTQGSSVTGSTARGNEDDGISIGYDHNSAATHQVTPETALPTRGRPAATVSSAILPTTIPWPGSSLNAPPTPSATRRSITPAAT
jgi:hypothetical protein